MEENKLYRVAETETNFWLSEIRKTGEYDSIGYLEELTPPKSLEELENHVLLEITRRYQFTADQLWNFLKPLISAMLVENQEAGISDTAKAVIDRISEENDKLQTRIKELEGNLAAEHRFRMEDGMSHINESNALIERIKELEDEIFSL